MTEDLYAAPKLWREDGMQECHRFPVAATQVLTLRDLFAMAALTGVMNKTGSFNHKILAFDAYMVADAMLEARKEKK